MSALTNLPRALRSFRGTRTQEEMAKLLGISSRTWSDYERGYRKLSVKRLDEILTCLDLSVWELADALEGERPADRAVERDVIRDVLRPLIKEETEQRFREVFAAFMDSRSGGAGGDGRRKDRREVNDHDENEAKRA